MIVIIGLMFAVGTNRAVYEGPAHLPDPAQIMLDESEIVVLKTSAGEVKLELLARYIISAGVRGRKNYRS
ncbi:MAG TPA: hypothetical protein VK905_02595, partial [Bacillota bacterium]|nr:hypothetical protein [Bacillota bacterium]